MTRLIDWSDPTILHQLHKEFETKNYPCSSLINLVANTWSRLSFEEKVNVFTNYNYPAFTYIHEFKFSSIDVYPRSREERIRYNELMIDYLRRLFPSYYDSAYLIERFNEGYDSALDKEFFYQEHFRKRLKHMEVCLDEKLLSEKSFSDRSFYSSFKRRLLGHSIDLDQLFDDQTEDFEKILCGRTEAEFYTYLKNFDSSKRPSKKTYQPIPISKNKIKQVVELFAGMLVAPLGKEPLIRTSELNLLRMLIEAFVDHKGETLSGNTLQKYKLFKNIPPDN